MARNDEHKLSAKERKLVEMIAEGFTTRQVAETLGVALSTIFRWLEHPGKQALREQYARAREAQGDAYADKVIEVVEDKTLDPAEKRVRMDAYKWAAGKRKPKVYGDKVHQEVSGPDGGPIEIKSESPRDILAARLDAIAARTGAGQPSGNADGQAG